MKKWFCAEEALTPAVKMAAFNAGYMVAQNNRELMVRVIPVAQDLLGHIENGYDKNVINSIFRDAVGTLVSEIKDPVIAANVTQVLAMIKLDIKAPEIPAIDLGIIKGLIEAFLQGAAAVK